MRGLRAVFLVLLTIGLVGYGIYQAVPGSPPAALECGDVQAEFFRFVTEAITQGYSYLEYKQEGLGFEWNEVVAHYQGRVLGVDEATFLYLVGEMLSLFGDGHTHLIHEPQATQYSLPLDLQWDGQAFRISAFTKEVAQKIPWLEVGVEVLSIDDREIGQVFDGILASSGYSLVAKGRELLLQDFFSTYFFYAIYPEQSEVTLILREDGVDRSVSLPWSPRGQVRSDMGVHLFRGGQGLVMGEFGEVGYLRIDTLSPSRYTLDEIDQAFLALAEKEALILDLRNNQGGDFSTYGRRILAHLVKEPVQVGAKIFRNSPYLHAYGRQAPGYPGNPLSPSAFYPPLELWVDPIGGVWRERPVVILVNERIFSSGDLLLSALVDLEVGHVMGRTAPANSGQPLWLESPWSGWGMRMSSILSLAPSGEIIEDRVISPDCWVPLTRKEILGDEDPILAAALALLEKEG